LQQSCSGRFCSSDSTFGLAASRTSSVKLRAFPRSVRSRAPLGAARSLHRRRAGSIEATRDEPRGKRLSKPRRARRLLPLPLVPAPAPPPISPARPFAKADCRKVFESLTFRLRLGFLSSRCRIHPLDGCLAVALLRLRILLHLDTGRLPGRPVARDESPKGEGRNVDNAAQPPERVRHRDHHDPEDRQPPVDAPHEDRISLNRCPEGLDRIHRALVPVREGSRNGKRAPERLRSARFLEPRPVRSPAAGAARNGLVSLLRVAKEAIYPGW